MTFAFQSAERLRASTLRWCALAKFATLNASKEGSAVLFERQKRLVSVEQQRKGLATENAGVA